MPGLRSVGDNTDHVGLRALNLCKLKWRLPDDPVADEVLIPALRAADHFDCMVGFFGAQALRQLAPGLASFVAGSEEPMRLLVSPLLSDSDLAGIRMGLTTAEDVLADAVGASLADPVALEDALANHTLHCLAYLLATRRLQMRLVLVDDGIFHVKEWILRAGGDIAVLAGSANFTGRAMSRNVEALHLHRSWRDLDNLDTCTESLAEFELLWNGRKHNARTVDIHTALAEDLVRTYADDDPPTEADYWRAVEAEQAEPDDLARSGFHIPRYLDINAGAYAHQGRAVEAWESAGRIGILAMATGAGKTISALVASHRMMEDLGSLAIVIAVPTRPLVTQWAEECGDFGLVPVVAPVLERRKRLRTVQLALDNLAFSVSSVEAIIVTNEGLFDEDLVRMLNEHDGPMLLIADEVHNLGGVKSFIEHAPIWPTARLGLSATPERQYDDEGTDALFDYFGNVVFDFSLDDAIGVCLVPYDYFVHAVELTSTELVEYVQLSDRIKKRIAQAGGSIRKEDVQLTILLNKRRLILETASGKLDALTRLLDKALDGVKRTLFYATDKDPEQLIAINELLRERRIRAHQITETETGRGRLLSATMDAFAAGTLRALTAKRVLDEGLNVPQIDTAYIMASTTVRKQWVQRRGRVLRPSPATGKTHAVIHDFLVVPPLVGPPDDDERRLVEGELARCEEFARLARNRAAADGAYSVVNDIRTEFVT